MSESINLLDGLDIDLPDAGQGGAPGAGGPAAGGTGGSEAHFFGPYQLIQQVGSGGVARVMRARHIHPRYAETTFAIKILHKELSQDPKVLELFRHEAFVLSLLKHPNIVQTFEAGSQDGELFIAMEYIDGRDLDNMLTRCRKAKSPVPLVVAMHIVAEALKGMTYAHELCDADGKHLNLVHRDVNPANVFMSYDGRVKLGDFGVASIAAGHTDEKHRTVTGKVGYFAPEQLNGSEPDQRADVFALGVTMFELLTTTRLFEGDTVDEIMRANKRVKVPKPSSLCAEITPPLEEILLTALEAKPSNRFQTARDMLIALRPFVPPPIGMGLAVAALMRKIFLTEHIQELQLREGLAGGVARGSGQLVAVCTPDERGQKAFAELLLSRGYRATVIAGVDKLAGILISPTPPMALLMDVCGQGFSPAQCVAAIARSPRPVPIVAVSDALAPRWIHYADAIGAVDLVFKPFNIERVLSSVRAAMTGAASISSVVNNEVASSATVTPRVLLISRDPSVITRLSSGFGENDFDVDVVASGTEAIERTRVASYHAVILDAHPGSSADRHFASQLRACPAMGLVPVVYLTEQESLAQFNGVEADRCAVRPRSDAPVVIGDVLKRLWADTRLGRTFIRFAIVMPVELRYGGRAFTAETIDLSRGGIRVHCAQMPPVGTAVGLAMRLPGIAVSIEVACKVVRVDIPVESTNRMAAIGVEFERFAGRAEAEYITYLCSLDPSPSRPTLTLNRLDGSEPN